MSYAVTSTRKECIRIPRKRIIEVVVRSGGIGWTNHFKGQASLNCAVSVNEAWRLHVELSRVLGGLQEVHLAVDDNNAIELIEAGAAEIRRCQESLYLVRPSEAPEVMPIDESIPLPRFHGKQPQRVFGGVKPDKVEFQI